MGDVCVVSNGFECVSDFILCFLEMGFVLYRRVCFSICLFSIVLYKLIYSRLGSCALFLNGFCFNLEFVQIGIAYFFQHTCLFQSGGMVLYALLLEVLWFFFLQLNGFVFVLKCSEIFRWVSVLSISFEILFILVGDFEVSLKLFDSA